MTRNKRIRESVGSRTTLYFHGRPDTVPLFHGTQGLTDGVSHPKRRREEDSLLESPGSRDTKYTMEAERLVGVRFARSGRRPLGGPPLPPPRGTRGPRRPARDGPGRRPRLPPRACPAARPLRPRVTLATPSPSRGCPPPRPGRGRVTRPRREVCPLASAPPVVFRPCVSVGARGPP